MISNGFPYSAKPYKAYSDDLTVTSLVKSSPIWFHLAPGKDLTIGWGVATKKDNRHKLLINGMDKNQPLSFSQSSKKDMLCRHHDVSPWVQGNI
jgi:hypothetical protein